MIISISGVPGSGKTSVAKIIAERLGYRFYSMGDLRGKMALKKKITLDALNKIGEQEEWTDAKADDYQKELGEKKDDFVIEGRLSWHFIPRSFKVFLDCDPKVAAERIFLARQNRPDERPDEAKPENPEKMEGTIKARVASDVLRYDKYYGVDYRRPENYNLVVDTTDLPNAEATAQAILTALP